MKREEKKRERRKKGKKKTKREFKNRPYRKKLARILAFSFVGFHLCCISLEASQSSPVQSGALAVMGLSLSLSAEPAYRGHSPNY